MNRPPYLVLQEMRRSSPASISSWCWFRWPSPSAHRASARAFCSRAARRCDAAAGLRQRDADHPQPRAVWIPDPDSIHRRHRQAHRDRRAGSLRAAADSSQHAGGNSGRGCGGARVRHRHGHDRPAIAVASGAAAGRAHHHRGRSHRHRHHDRDRHHRGRHRRRRTRRFHLSRHRVGGHHADSGRRDSRGSARAALRRRIQLDRTTILCCPNARCCSPAAARATTSWSARRISPSN